MSSRRPVWGWRGPRHHLAHRPQRVELLALGVELDGQAHAVLAGDVADFPDAAGGFSRVPAAAIHRAHDRGAAERLRARGLLGEHAQQPRPLLAGGPHPAELHAHAGDGQARGAHQRQHLVGGLAGLGGALEVEAAQLDGVPARLLDDGERVRERSGVERPRVQRQAHGHGASPCSGSSPSAAPPTASGQFERLGQQFVGAHPRLEVVRDRDDDQLVGLVVGGHLPQPLVHLLGRAHHAAPGRVLGDGHLLRVVGIAPPPPPPTGTARAGRCTAAR